MSAGIASIFFCNSEEFQLFSACRQGGICNFHNILSLRGKKVTQKIKKFSFFEVFFKTTCINSEKRWNFNIYANILFFKKFFAV